ncbi:hypothetical protein [Bradyrhizobium sp. BR 1432]|uniref:hypothetical protein n=1 Tax=Bradyrhizobium sp. BR 1432 TaxID=3447966 RepID=UPI003EE52CDD
MSEVPLNDLLIEIDQLVVTARDPTQEPANHVEATPRAAPNEPLFDETSGVALDELSVRRASETPVQTAFAECSSTSIFLFSAVESGGTERTMPNRPNAGQREIWGKRPNSA